MMYAVIMDSEQFRNWIALTILLSGIHLLESSKYIDRFKFLLVWIASISFHYSFIFYAPLLFVTGENNNKWLKRFVIISMSFSLIIILNGNEIPFQSFIIDYTGNCVIVDYLNYYYIFDFLITYILYYRILFYDF